MKLKVKITRQCCCYSKVGDIFIDLISNVHWSNISGGVKQKRAGYSLFGYIDYTVGKDIVDCSGNHDTGRNNMKICIPKKENESGEYKEGYKILIENAGPKPQSIISLGRPRGYPPCTKQILQILENGPVSRIKLRTILSEMGYQATTIRNAINHLGKCGKIFFRGSSNSPNQIIEKGNK